MTIPIFTPEGILPPYVGDPTALAVRSPYPVSICDVVEMFSKNNKRIEILRGLLWYRAELRNLGVTEGFQWLDGSFVEDAENGFRGMPPGDIDIVTFFQIPIPFSDPPTPDQLVELVSFSTHLDDLAKMGKSQMLCDIYHISTNQLNIQLLLYWYGLFSHQKNTSKWKGILQISLEGSEDEKALDLLNLKAA